MFWSYLHYKSIFFFPGLCHSSLLEGWVWNNCTLHKPDPWGLPCISVSERGELHILYRFPAQEWNTPKICEDFVNCAFPFLLTPTQLYPSPGAIPHLEYPYIPFFSSKISAFLHPALPNTPRLFSNVNAAP